MGARTRRFASLPSSSNTTKAAGIAALCAVMLLAGCGGSAGIASDSSTPVIRGDVFFYSKGGVEVSPDVAEPTKDEQGVTVERQQGVTVAPEEDGGDVEIIAKKDAWFWGTEPGEPLDQGSADLKSVTFNSGANDVTGTMPVQIASAETALTENLFKRSGYVFDGWATTSNGSTEYADGFKYPFTTDATLYARWVAAPSSTVTFNANGGERTMGDQTANRLTPLKANEFTKSGYVFDGWATISTGDKAYGNGDDYKFGENVTLYARWVVAPSSTVMAPAATVPGAPGLTALSRRSKTEVWVTFSAPSSNGGKPITEYTVTVKGPNGRILTQSFPAQAGRVSVGQLNNSGFYTFTVRAVNSVGTSKPSNATRYLKLG